MMKIVSIFAVILLAELGDKTQLATLLFASDRSLNPVLVFASAALALVAATAVAVLVGNLGARYLEAIPLKLIAGVGFIAIGVWVLIEHFRSV